jgi:aminopeptidase N
VVTKHYANVQDVVSDNHASFRGALVLNMLRRHLGESKWQRAIRRYVKDNLGKQVTTEDFRRACEDASGEPLDWFFD